MNESTGRRLSRAEMRIARSIGKTTLPVDAFPIADPDLAALSELLHRMQVCKSNEPIQWMAGEAIAKLQKYVRKVSA